MILAFGLGGTVMSLEEEEDMLLFVKQPLDSPGSAIVCLFDLSPVREGSNIFGDHRGCILSNRAEPVRRVSADTNLNIFQHKELGLGARRKTTKNG